MEHNIVTYRFRRNVKYCMQLRNIQFTDLVNLYCEYMKKGRTDNDRKKISRLIYVYADSRKYITLEDVKCFSSILDVSPCYLAWGTLSQITQSINNPRPTG